MITFNTDPQAKIRQAFRKALKNHIGRPLTEGQLQAMRGLFEKVRENIQVIPMHYIMINFTLE